MLFGCALKTQLGSEGHSRSDKSPVARLKIRVLYCRFPAYALGSLQIRQYDPLGNLRKAGE
jgi:hypothetical protein